MLFIFITNLLPLKESFVFEESSLLDGLFVSFTSVLVLITSGLALGPAGVALLVLVVDVPTESNLDVVPLCVVVLVTGFRGTCELEWLLETPLPSILSVNLFETEFSVEV